MASFGSPEKGSVNVELNIVPFIDLMSCLTAFLLVTAVWVNVANLHDEPAGRARGDVAETEHPKLSILLDADSIRVSAYPSGGGMQLAANDWDSLATAMHHLQLPEEGARVEIAALSTNAHPIAYQALVLAMDTAVKAGYADVGVTDPSSLAR